MGIGRAGKVIAESIAGLALSIWLYLLFGRGGFWRIRVEGPPPGPLPRRSVAVIIPARDEAAVIGRAVRSLLTQQYAGRIKVFVVDDHSTDGTAGLAQGATVISADPLPTGWTGKLWAIQCGFKEAARANPDYFLLTDADIVHASDNIAGLVARAETYKLDLVSLMVKLRCESLAERALIPAFLYFFLQLYPPAWIAQPKARTAGAAGGCILIRPQALARIGGIAAIRSELIDDCALASRVKKTGPIWMGVADQTLSIREYRSFGEIGRMISRTAFTQLRHSTLLLIATVLGLLLTYVAGPVFAIAGPTPAARLVGLTAWLLMTITFLPALQLYGRSPAWALVLPLIAWFYLGATIYSAAAYWTGQGGLWKGRYNNCL